MASILIIGQGKLGFPLAEQLAKHHDVTAVRRSMPSNDNVEFTTLSRNISQPFSLNIDHFDYVYFIVSPSESSEASYQSTYVDGLKNTLNALSTVNKHLFIVSSTRVYGRCAPNTYQTELSEISLKDKRAELLYAMEQLGFDSSFNCSIIRFSGLYRGDSQRLRNVARAIADNTREWPQASHSNRFHYDDAIQLLISLFQQYEKGAKLEAVYLGTDNDCITNHQLIRFFAEQEQLNLPQAPHTENVQGKRLKSLYIKEIITLKYPSYREGYTIS